MRLNFLKEMSNYIRLHKGLNIPIIGDAKPQLTKTVISDIIAVKPTDFRAVTPKLLVKEGDAVKAGDTIFADKYRPEILFVSPCSGIISEVVRGDKRKLLEIRIKADSVVEHKSFTTPQLNSATKEDVIKSLLESGLWPCLKQRPYGTIPNPADNPKAIFISGFNTAPLAADVNYVLKDELDNIQAGVDALNKLTKGGVHVGVDVSSPYSVFNKLKNITAHSFEGKHPAGNVGIQIHHISPINKGEVVWTIDPHFLVTIGKFFKQGICDFSKTIAITGPCASNPSYISALPGMCMSNIAEYVTKIKEQEVRFISGDVLSGNQISKDGYLGFYNNQISLISEGDYYEAFGWVKPIRPKKFSFSCSYFSWLTPKKKYSVDTNLNGGQRAFVMTGLYEKVLPMDILPMYLIKAIMAEDIDKMEQLGIYEVIEEDLALCEYVCPSKVEVQDIVSKGIDLMIKEMA